MAVQLTACTTEEQRSWVKFLWVEGVRGMEIRRRLSAKHGFSVLPERNVYGWIAMLRSV
jgi:hypothetical protein